MPVAPANLRDRLPGHIELAAGGALGAAASILPQNVQAALANPPKHRGSMRDIKHVVMLMQENRSFDHYFGTLSGVRGFGDPHAAKLPGGKSVFHQPDPAGAGELLPFHLDTRTTNAQALPSTDHGWVPQHSSWNNGKMDNWLPAHRLADGDDVGPYVMGYLTREDIPFQYALADAFTVLDAYHCSVLGPRAHRPEPAHVDGRHHRPERRGRRTVADHERAERAVQLQDVPGAPHRGGGELAEISDHTSQLRFLERLTGVKEPNITDWRRRTVGDLTSAFRFDDGIDEPPVLPDTQGQLNLAKYEVAHLPAPAVPTSNQHVPSQEKGHRPHVG